ncbi:hypothetical protein C8R42DRAFT_776438 [Lentinula raphanica]|nr:hypothetical protein C8R42DRAFT_776438 [Lentinula raphanica]
MVDPFSDNHDDLKIYKTCMDLQASLLSLPGFGIHFVALLDGPDPVVCIRELCHSGIPLCYLFNLLPVEHYPRIELNFTTSHNSDYAQRLAIVQFAMRVSQAFKCEYFTVNDLPSSNGFEKALGAVSAVLDRLTSAGMTQGFSKRFLNNRGTPDRQHECSALIDTLLESERGFVAQMETMENFSRALSVAGMLEPKSLPLIFPKKMFVFCRKFCIQLECVAQVPWEEQNWGSPFILRAMDMTMNLSIHCVNWILAKPGLASFDMETLQIPGFKATSKSIDALASVPLQRISYYRDFLVASTYTRHVYLMLKASVQGLLTFDLTEHKYHKELVLGVACVQQVMDTISKAQRKAITDQVCQTLQSRVADWQILDINSLGQFILERNLLTRRNDLLQNFDVFMFENEILLCDEAFPPVTPAISRRSRRRAISISTPPSQVGALYIKDRIPTSGITDTTRTEFERVKDNGPHLFFQLTLSMEDRRSLSFLFPEHDDMQKWYDELQPLKRKSTIGDQTLGNTDQNRGQQSWQRKRAATYSGKSSDVDVHPSASTSPRSTFDQTALVQARFTKSEPPRLLLPTFLGTDITPGTRN